MRVTQRESTIVLVTQKGICLFVSQVLPTLQLDVQFQRLAQSIRFSEVKSYTLIIYSMSLMKKKNPNKI